MNDSETRSTNPSVSDQILELGIPTFSVWDELPRLGFQPTTELISDRGSALEFDFGNLRLSAVYGLNRWLKEVVSFGGHHYSSRSIGEIAFEIPPMVVSREMCLALLVEGLRCGEPNGFLPMKRVPWVIEGLSQLRNLPRRKNLDAYANRPLCMVERDWMRLGLKKLKEALHTVLEQDVVLVTFDGEILRFRCGEELVAMPARGNAWPLEVTLDSCRLRELPPRLPQPFIQVSFWDSKLFILNRSYQTHQTNTVEFQPGFVP